ncbi:MAG TPA: hypothetical protein VNW92_05390, partial [Polyangiaceae bacterium]|nr:hypothetical protein [Polyangiaceae bacterium]
MRYATFLGLLLLGCSTRGAPVPPGSAQHSPAEPRPELHASPKPSVSADAGGDSVRSSTGFVLKGGSVFGMGKQNLLIDSGHVIALGVSPG